MNKYYWAAISNDERINAINEITGIVNRFATISNFQKFSDISLNLILELEECYLNNLLNELKEILSLDSINASFPDSKTPCIVLLNITFTKGTGYLEIEVPDISE